MRKCSKCKEEKPLNEYYFDKSKDRHYYYCKKCHYKLTYPNQRTEKYKRWRRGYYKRNAERERKRTREFMSKYQKTEKYKEWHSNYQKKRRTESKFAICESMRVLMWRALKEKKKGLSWESLVGYNVDDLYNHLEKQFDDKMNWDNHGTYWEIDHIIPRKHFNYTKPEDPEFKECWELENLQPLEAIENRRKGGKLIGYTNQHLKIAL